MSDHDALIIGVGNAFRRDDAAGLQVIDRLARSLPGEILKKSDGDIADLVHCFGSHREIVLVDAANGGGTSGTVREFDGLNESVGATALRSSTHAMSVAEAVALARSLELLPEKLTVYAIVGSDFQHGTGVSAPVADAVSRVAKSIERLYSRA